MLDRPKPPHEVNRALHADEVEADLRARGDGRRSPVRVGMEEVAGLTGPFVAAPPRGLQVAAEVPPHLPLGEPGWQFNRIKNSPKNWPKKLP